MERIEHFIQLPNDVKEIHQIFKKEGFELYPVGGCIRDSILGVQPKDWDLVTNLIPDEVIKLLKGRNFVKNILETGKSFGVVNVITSDSEYEIATMRSDGEYSDGRRPDSVVFGDMESDCMRRDIRFNALFYDIDAQEVIDFVGGVNDLKKALVRMVGNPADRFNEDPLRIMRAVRFSARFGSELDSEAHEALVADSSLSGISAERIRDEFLKGIKSAKSAVSFLKLLETYKLFDWIFKGLDINQDFIESKDPIIVIADILKRNDLAKLSNKLNTLKYTIEESKAIVFLLNLMSLTAENAIKLKKQERNAGVTAEQIKTFANIQKIDSKLIDAFLVFKLSVSGEDLMKLGYNEGPELGRAINAAEYANFIKLLS